MTILINTVEERLYFNAGSIQKVLESVSSVPGSVTPSCSSVAVSQQPNGNAGETSPLGHKKMELLQWYLKSLWYVSIGIPITVVQECFALVAPLSLLLFADLSRMVWCAHLQEL